MNFNNMRFITPAFLPLNLKWVLANSQERPTSSGGKQVASFNLTPSDLHVVSQKKQNEQVTELHVLLRELVAAWVLFSWS